MRKVGDTVWRKIEADNVRFEYEPFYNPYTCVVAGVIRSLRPDGRYDVVYDHPAFGPACAFLTESEILPPETSQDKDGPCE